MKKEDKELEKEVDESTEKETELDENEQKISELTALLDEQNDKYLRLRAEFDNFRKRTQKEKTEAYSESTARTVLEILPAVDNFERALEAECEDAEFKKGVEMIFNQLNEILIKLGVTEIEALGAEFNPDFHNAIKQVEDEEQGQNIVCQVFQKGYMLGDKVVRHAMVAVANP